MAACSLSAHFRSQFSRSRRLPYSPLRTLPLRPARVPTWNIETSHGRMDYNTPYTRRHESRSCASEWKCSLTPKASCKYNRVREPIEYERDDLPSQTPRAGLEPCPMLPRMAPAPTPCPSVKTMVSICGRGDPCCPVPLPIASSTGVLLSERDVVRGSRTCGFCMSAHQAAVPPSRRVLLDTIAHLTHCASHRAMESINGSRVHSIRESQAAIGHAKPRLLHQRRNADAARCTACQCDCDLVTEHVRP